MGVGGEVGPAHRAAPAQDAAWLADGLRNRPYRSDYADRKEKRFWLVFPDSRVA